MLAIIPARGGSKGLPGKNIKPLLGKPLIHWTIEAAMRASSIDRIILSTDDQSIVDSCKHLDVDIPFMRPDALAQDTSSAVDVYRYTMERLIKEFDVRDENYVVLLPTVPFRNAQDIDAAVALFKEEKADSVISCKKLSFPIDWAFLVDNDSKRISRSADSAVSMNNRQMYNDAYVANGGIYVLRHSLVDEHRSYYFSNTLAYEMPEFRSIDIDTAEDFKLAEYFAPEMIGNE
jgi:CMP-N,N'-diacetyllegionaminic acid synthase